MPSTKGGPKHSDSQAAGGRGATVPAGLKPKDLIGIPWRVALALQADGWWLRSDIVWAKPNPMPESVRDRPTRAHEYVFLLTKSAKYWYDSDAVKTPVCNSTIARIAQPTLMRQKGGPKDPGSGNRSHRKVLENLFRSNAAVYGGRHKAAGYGTRRASGRADHGSYVEAGANLRDVWTIPTASSKEAHYAVMPERLAELCIKAGCPAGGTVLDPFAGSGTTGLVADRLGRDAILIDLNPANAAMAERRVRADAPLFAAAETA